LTIGTYGEANGGAPDDDKRFAIGSRSAETAVTLPRGVYVDRIDEATRKALVK
jgi:hypothetical protein